MICPAMPGLSRTSRRECLYAEDAWANTIFVLFSIRSLQGKIAMLVTYQGTWKKVRCISVVAGRT